MPIPRAVKELYGFGKEFIDIYAKLAVAPPTYLIELSRASKVSASLLAPKKFFKISSRGCRFGSLFVSLSMVNEIP